MTPCPRPQLRHLRTAVRALALVALFPAAGAAQEPADEDSSYSYVRTIEGRATLASEGRGPGEEADLNQPLLQGDTVRVAGGARVEIALADRNLLRAGAETTVTLARVAFSADRDDRTTRLDLQEGEILLLVGEDALGDELPEIRTPAGTIYVHEPGEYRVTFDRNGGLEVVVRSGYAELLTERGSTVVRTGEAAWADGDRWSRVEIADAGPHDSLELWGEELDREAYAADPRTLYVEPEYRYAAAPLARYGSWIYIDSTWSWRPRVTVDWRPYWNGRWAWTPSGLTWVSAEPWGWLPYHYGTWYQAPGYGWCWRPGRVYAPAWVYWHVGPRWTGWVPVGYYTHHYRNHWSNGFRFGLYGWAGGSWSYYSDWNFCPTQRVYDRYDRSWRHTGDHVGRLAGHEGPHGLVTTDTRGLDRGDWARGDVVVAKMGRRAGAPGRLPTVTDFVARKRELPPEVEHAVIAERRGGRRIATPLDPQPAGIGSSGGRGSSSVVEARPAPGWRNARDGRVAGGVSTLPTRESPPTRGRSSTDYGRVSTLPTREDPPEVRRRDPIPMPDRRGGTATVDRGGNGRGGSAVDESPGTRWRQPVEMGRPGDQRSAPAGPRTLPAPRGGGGNDPVVDDRRGWRQSSPYVRGGEPSRTPSGPSGVEARPAREVRALPSPRQVPTAPGYRRPENDSRSRGVERSDDPPVTRVIGGVRRGAPESEGRSGSPYVVPRGGSGSARSQHDGSGSARPGYSVPQAPRAPAQPGYRSPSGGGASVQPRPSGRSAPVSGTVQQRPAGGSQVSSPPPSRGNSSSSASGSRGSSGSSGNSNRSDSSPPKRGGSGKQGRDR